MTETGKKLLAITLAEVLITVVIVGLSAALLIKTVNKARPDKEKVAYVKAFNTTRLAVHNILNDPSKYDQDPEAVEFSDFSTDPLPNNANRAIGATGKSNAFCAFMAKEMNVQSGSCGGSPDLITTDGMYWYGLSGAFSDPNAIAFVPKGNLLDSFLFPQAMALVATEQMATDEIEGGGGGGGGGGGYVPPNPTTPTTPTPPENEKGEVGTGEGFGDVIGEGGVTEGSEGSGTGENKNKATNLPGTKTIYVDTNGDTEGGKCGNALGCGIKIYSNGKVQPAGAKESKYLTER